MFEGLNDEEDDAFFTPSTSSNLASLFGINMAQAKESSANTSLTYTAPKQPTKIVDAAKNSTKVKHESKVILFKEVHAFKVIEKNYQTQGKCGLALIGNDTIQIYQLLLYKQKHDIISTSKVYDQFQFVVQKDNYATYCDDNKQNWTIHFTCDSDLNDFVAALETKGGQVKTYQEASPSDTENVPDTVVEEHSDKESSINVDSDNNQSDNKANILSRMAKMGQRILLPNPNISDGTDSDTDKDKSIQNRSNRKNKRIPTAQTPSVTASTNQLPEIPKKSPNLLSNRSTSSVPVPVALRQPIIPQQYTLVNGQYVPIVSPQYIPLDMPVIAPDNVSSSVMCTPTQTTSYDNLQMYFTENRTQNSEVRMNLLRLTNKVEEVLDKIQRIETKPSTETTIANIENKEKILKQENENLKLLIKKLEKNNEETNQLLQEKCNIESELLLKENAFQKISGDLQGNIMNHEKKESEYIETIKTLEEKVANLTENLKEQETNSMKLDENKEVKFENVEDIIKKIMNSFYRDIDAQFDDDKDILGKDVKKIVAQKIINNTYNIISSLKELNAFKLKENNLE